MLIDLADACRSCSEEAPIACQNDLDPLKREPVKDLA